MKAQVKFHLMIAATTACVTFATFADDATAKAAPATKPAATAAKPAAKPAAKKADDGKQYAPIAEARAKIGAIIADPALMTEVIKTLSPEDQKTFVADVNAAIAKLPGSVEDRTAKYLNINRAAYKGAATGNMANLLAVTFATVPPESLTVLSERYAVDLFNRDTDNAQRMNDATYIKTAREVIGKVVQATTGSDDSGVRNTLAILMFVRADNGKINDLSDKLIDVMPDATTRELAKTDWIPAAMAEGDNKSYDGLLAYADAGKCPDLNIVLNMAGPQILDAALVDITSAMDNDAGIQTTPILDQAFGGFDEPLTHVHGDTASISEGNMGVVPRTADPDAPWNPEYKRDDPNKPSEAPEKKEKPEPKPYPYSSL